MDTVCIRYAVAMYCLTRYINIYLSTTTITTMSTQARLSLHFNYTTVSSSASVIEHDMDT